MGAAFDQGKSQAGFGAPGTRNLTLFWKDWGKGRRIDLVHKIVYLSLGSNLGDREGNLRTAIERLKEIGNSVAVSSFYETEPVEVATTQPWFLNCAVKLDTEK